MTRLVKSQKEKRRLESLFSNIKADNLFLTQDVTLITSIWARWRQKVEGGYDVRRILV
jgi:hypothetical protein